MSDENDGLASIPEHPEQQRDGRMFASVASNRWDDSCTAAPAVHEAIPATKNRVSQWEVLAGGNSYFPTGDTSREIPAAAYQICMSQRGIYFERVPIIVSKLVRFPETNSDKVIEEIRSFWDKKDRFVEHGLVFKRGILLWGPPGGGKTSAIQFVMRDVVERGGIVIVFNDSGLFVSGMALLREIHPTKPIVVLMEDLDSILRRNNESEVLNILDGVNQIDNVVYLATTNYPERLGGRIVNRPSRFDKRFKIGFPNEESRRMYLNFLTKDDPEKYGIDMDQWIQDTEDFSIAHIKELFTAVIVLGDPYDKAIRTLSKMNEMKISSEYDAPQQSVGFCPQPIGADIE